MTELRILADDLTGALDTAATLAGRTPVYLDVPPSTGRVGASTVGLHRTSVVATNTRDLPVPQLPKALAPSVPWLQAADIAFKKVDSLWRGNTFAELKHLAASGAFDRLVFAPALPEQGRTVSRGRLVVQGDPAWPAVSALDALADCARPVWVPDAQSDDDLLALVEQGLAEAATPSRTLWCGSAGLAQALALKLGVHASSTASASALPDPTPGLHASPRAAVHHAPASPCLVISASHHPTTRRQWARVWAEAGWQSSAVALQVRQGDPAALGAALRNWPSQAFIGGKLALLDLSPASRLTREQAALKLAQQVSDIVKACATRRPGVVVVVGGDGLRALCDASGAIGLLSEPAFRPGWGAATLLGGAWQGLRCHTRSGAFGDDDDLAQMLRRLTVRS